MPLLNIAKVFQAMGEAVAALLDWPTRHLVNSVIAQNNDKVADVLV